MPEARREAGGARSPAAHREVALGTERQRCDGSARREVVLVVGVPTDSGRAVRVEVAEREGEPCPGPPLQAIDERAQRAQPGGGHALDARVAVAGARVSIRVGAPPHLDRSPEHHRRLGVERRACPQQREEHVRLRGVEEARLVGDAAPPGRVVDQDAGVRRIGGEGVVHESLRRGDRGRAYLRSMRRRVAPLQERPGGPPAGPRRTPCAPPRRQEPWLTDVRGSVRVDRPGPAGDSTRRPADVQGSIAGKPRLLGSGTPLGHAGSPHDTG